MLGVSPATIRLWEEQGKIRCERTPGGRRRVPELEIRRLGGMALPQNEAVAALYVRVSSHDQKARGDLNRQEERLRAAVRALGLPDPT
jgi:putative resolvase